MKKFLRVLRNIVIGIVVLAGLIYGGVYLGHKVFFKMPYTNKPTISVIGNGDFTFGAASRKQPKNTKEYIKVLASQVKNYNEHIDSYWPDNLQKNQSVIAQDLETKAAYLISPEGQQKKLSQKEFDSYNVPGTFKLDGQWAPFKGNGVSGAYITVSPTGLTNYYNFQKYEHLGTYDQFLSYSHELFHSLTQQPWANNNYGNKDRDERLDDSSARQTRMLLQQQLAAAISEPEQRESHIKDAVATYQYYQIKNKKDYEAALYFDRIEGSAFYYEIISALYAGYPAEIKNHQDAYHALEVILADDNPAYRRTGVTAEAYRVGGYAGVLLDLLAIEQNEDPFQWKEKLVQDGKLTPMMMLEQKYTDADLPSVQSIPSKKAYEKWMTGFEKIEPTPTKVQKFFELAYGILF